MVAAAAATITCPNGGWRGGRWSHIGEDDAGETRKEEAEGTWVLMQPNDEGENSKKAYPKSHSMELQQLVVE